MNRNLRQLLQDFARPVAVKPRAIKAAAPMVKPAAPMAKSIRRNLNEGTRALRAERRFLLQRYDFYALPPGLYAHLRQLEIELGWRQHQKERPL
jgi:hypothetical protein